MIELSNGQPMDLAPTDGSQILVYFDHDADPYQIDEHLTDYAAEAESGCFLDGKGFCIATWCEGFQDGNPMEGEPLYWVPANWFEWANGDNGCVCNPIRWWPLPKVAE